MSTSLDYKEAARIQWTSDPCGPRVDGALGTAPYFQRLIDERRRHAPWMAEALDYAGSGGLRVLDVGCGQGIDLANYAAHGAIPTGIDLTPRHVELARLHLTACGFEAEVLEADAENMPFPDRSFDRVGSNGVLHHTPDMLAALREIHRVLVPGGQACIIVYNRSSLHYWLEQVVKRGLVLGHLLTERSMAGVLSGGVEYSRIEARPLVRVYTRSQVTELMRDAGFVRVATEIRHFAAGDTFISKLLAPHVHRLRDPEWLDRIGRKYGWYIVARGVRPTMG